MVFNLFDLIGFPGLDLVWDVIAFFISLIVILMLVQINAKIEQSGKLSTDVTRKVIHIFAAPLWVLTWMLFSGGFFSRYLAIIVPLFFVLQFVMIGTGRMENKDFVDSMSRSGDPKELLGGTLYYALLMVFFGIVSFYWGATNTTPLAIIVFACLAGGDGLADVIGRKYGGEKKFGIMGSERTIAGSIGMFLGSFLFSFILMFFFSFEINAWNPIPLLLPLIVISLVATIVEALSPKGLDNWTVPIVIAILMIFIVFIFPVWTFPNQTLW
ncbi:MAG: diacylglycerol/polyprenol kinase family protein [Candidatus Thorarchaeota archaeon]|jgi:dolichol kinase